MPPINADQLDSVVEQLELGMVYIREPGRDMRWAWHDQTDCGEAFRTVVQCDGRPLNVGITAGIQWCVEHGLIWLQRAGVRRFLPHLTDAGRLEAARLYLLGEVYET